MANRYGEAALMAARKDKSAGVDPVARWESAMEKLYPTSRSARNKRGPRGAFLGLCEDGLVIGIPAAPYKASRDNKGYAVRAVTLLTEGTQHRSISALWRAVTNGADKAHDSQMDVVLALWNNDLILGKH
jgi:hypothetical protein